VAQIPLEKMPLKVLLPKRRTENKVQQFCPDIMRSDQPKLAHVSQANLVSVHGNERNMRESFRNVKRHRKTKIIMAIDHRLFLCIDTKFA